jgi:oligopeptide/dipeptide ABC transporter ATP-binding protein
MSLLEVEGLEVSLGLAQESVRILREVSFTLEAGQTLGIVGESGCGKSMTALAVMGLLPTPHRLQGRVRFRGLDLTGADAARWSEQRGRHMAMIFQEPMTSLNPVLTVGFQLAEMLVQHEHKSSSQAMMRAVELLEQVGIAEPARRAQAYPHEMSGGMRQRVMIAMALACKPQLLIADEPTTALDVSVQAQILDLMLQMQHDHGTAMMFISHNFGVISEMADEVMVMYAGTTVEQGLASQVLQQPRHPYTRGLLSTVPDLDRRVDRLPIIAGSVPDLARLPEGCSFQSRCDRADADCRRRAPALVTLDGSGAVGPAGRPTSHQVACLHA